MSKKDLMKDWVTITKTIPMNKPYDLLSEVGELTAEMSMPAIADLVVVHANINGIDVGVNLRPTKPRRNSTNERELFVATRNFAVCLDLECAALTFEGHPGGDEDTATIRYMVGCLNAYRGNDIPTVENEPLYTLDELEVRGTAPDPEHMRALSKFIMENP